MAGIVKVVFDEAKIDAIFADVDRSDLPGAAVGIAIDGKPVYRKGFGLASLELPVTLSPHIRMRIGSTTKHFAALAFMLLCESKQADLDDPIGRYLPELHPATASATIRHLLGHIAGVRDVFNMCWTFGGRGRRITSEELLAEYRTIDDVSSAPRETWMYNNGGYLLVSTAVERITGQSLENVLRERIFEPVGMHDTLLRRFDDDFVPNSAMCHVKNADGTYSKGTLGTAIGGEGGIVSTVDDMLRWLAHMDAPVVGTTASWTSIKTPQTLRNGTSTEYGLGLTSAPYRGARMLRHGGGVAGGNSEMLKIPDAKLDLAIMVNRDDVLAHDFGERVLDACLTNLTPFATFRVRTPISAVYRSTSSEHVAELSERDGRQFFELDALEIEMESDRDGVLRPVGRYRFAKIAVKPSDASARPASIQVSHFGNIENFATETRAQEADSDAIAGKYQSKSAGIHATVSAQGGVPELVAANRYGTAVFALQPLIRGVWKAQAKASTLIGGIITFSGDNNEFRFSNSNTLSLPFRRVA